MKAISETDRIPLWQKLVFSTGSSMDYLVMGMTVGTLWMPYFNIGLGISPTLLGLILMGLQAWNAFIDPVMGNVSDNARTPWGRRRPFMAVGSVAAAFLLPLLLRPPAEAGIVGIAWYLGGVGLLFFTAYSCWAMPYYGMQLELTPNYDERTRLTAWMAFISKLNGLAAGWIMAIVTGPWFKDPATGRADIVRGVQTCSWGLALLILMTGMLPAIFIRERYYEKEARSQAKEPFLKSLKDSARHGPLWALVGIMFFLVLGSSAVGSLGQYLNIYYVFGGDIGEASIVTGWKTTVIMLTGIACIPLWTWLGERFDKQTVVGAMLLLSIAGHVLNYWCLNPALPYLQLVPGVFESGAISALWIFLPSMKGDIADYDERATARRREGSINAFFSWFFKVAMTCSMGLGGLVLDISGFNAKLESPQPEEVLNRMFALFLVIPAFFWLCGFAIALFYPLNRNRMAEIRSELEQRRGAV